MKKPKENLKIIGDAVSSGILFLSLLIFVIVGLSTGIWHPTWIAILLGVAFCGISAYIFEVIIKIKYSNSEATAEPALAEESSAQGSVQTTSKATEVRAQPKTAQKAKTTQNVETAQPSAKNDSTQSTKLANKSTQSTKKLASKTTPKNTQTSSPKEPNGATTQKSTPNKSQSKSSAQNTKTKSAPKTTKNN